VGALLISQWLGGADAYEIVDEASVSVVRDAVRGRATMLEPSAREQLVAAASELAHNQLAHASGGVIGVRAISREGVAGIEVIAADRGRGIVDPRTALRGIPRASGSLGVGLSAARRQAAELDVDVRIGEGTCIRARTFAGPVTPSEVGIYARAHPGELVIGDHAGVQRDDTATTIAVIDGLGHGQPARDAANLAFAEVGRGGPLEVVMQQTHRALGGTRGAVMSIARVAGTAIEHAGIGNIATRIVGTDGSLQLLPSAPGTLGSTLPRRIAVEPLTRRATDLVVLCSDGILTRCDLADEPNILREHPIAIAQRIVERFLRGTDDAIVAVAR
jgi:anti-sigma regulatory factor (Ser/Thr protein kinase)